MTTISESRRQKFANGTLDACERYFTGKRVANQEDKENGWLKALRIGSLFTGVVPVGFAIAFLAAKIAIRPDEEMREYWESRIVVEEKRNEKEFYVDLLISSGITETHFEKIYILTASPSANVRFFAADGHFSEAMDALSPEQQKQVLALHVYTDKKMYKKNRNDYYNYQKGVPNEPPSACTARALSVTDHTLLLNFHKIPNLMKKILQDGETLQDDEENGIT